MPYSGKYLLYSYYNYKPINRGAARGVRQMTLRPSCQSTWRRSIPNTPRARTAFSRRCTTVVARPSPHESNPDRARSVSQPLQEQRGLKTPVLLFVHASSVRHASNNSRLRYSSVSWALPQHHPSVARTLRWRPGLGLRRWCRTRVADP